MGARQRQTTGNGGTQNNRPKAKSRGGGATERRNEMFYAFQNLVLETWSFWCGLFKPLPYGDPFVATFALVVLFAMATKLIAGGDAA